MKSSIDIWKIEIGFSDGMSREMLKVLSDQEKGRALAFHRERDGIRFITFHFALRSILATYVRTDPQGVSFSHAEFGKPEITAPPFPIWFNLCHSEDTGLLAISRGGEIGADVEHVAHVGELVASPEGILSASQLDEFHGIPSALKPIVLTECWVRKEAYLKALGIGLGIEPANVDVSLDLTKTFGTIHSFGHRNLWKYRSLDLTPGLRGAICFQGNEPELTFYSWDGKRRLPNS